MPFVAVGLQGRFDSRPLVVGVDDGAQPVGFCPVLRACSGLPLASFHLLAGQGGFVQLSGRRQQSISEGLGDGGDVGEVARYGFVPPAAGVKTAGQQGIAAFRPRLDHHTSPALFPFVEGVRQLGISAGRRATQPNLVAAAAMA